MTPTPEQIRQALVNHMQPPRTHHAKVRDALLHVKQAEKKPATSPKEAGGLITVTGQHYGTDASKVTGP